MQNNTNQNISSLLSPYKTLGKGVITEMEKPLMKCGHIANAELEVEGVVSPCCAICSGENAYKVDKFATTNLVFGRMAECSYCGKSVASNISLPFFKHNDEQDTDTYYCGCFGWD